MSFLGICNNSNFLSVVLLVKNLIDIISIAVPIILILMLSIELSKIVMGNTDKMVPKVVKSVVVKTIAAVAIFFIPTLVNVLLSMLNQTNYVSTDCWNNANSLTIAEFKAVEEANKIQAQEDVDKEKKEAKQEREKVEKIREEARKENEKKARMRIKPVE